MNRVGPLLILLSLSPSACRKDTRPPGEGTSPDVQVPLEVANEVTQAMDPNTDPCVDFYRYACGGWLDNTPRPPDEPRYGRFHVLRDRNLVALRDILETAEQGDAGTEHAKLGRFYGACMDEQKAEQGGTAAIAPLLTAIDDANDLGQLLYVAGVLVVSGSEPLFSANVGPDYEQPDTNRAHFTQGGLGLPDRDYYLGTAPEQVALREAYRDHVATVLGLLGRPDAASEAEAILAFETRIAEASLPRAELRNPDLLRNPIDRAGLAALTPGIPWDAWFAGVGLPGAQALNVAPTGFFTSLQATLQETPLDTVKAYLRWQLVHAFARELPKAYAEAHFAFFDQRLRGQQSLPPRWKQCVRTADGALGELLGQAYVERHFAGDSKATALGMIHQIEAAFQAGLAELPWMDATTRARAIEKMAAIVNKVGHPDRFRDYSRVEVGTDHLANVLAARRFESARQLAMVGQPVDRSEWHMSPPTVNAYYNPPSNEMVFPAGILQPPFFHPDYPMAMNFGGIGMVMGHELTHGFDDEGRKFDGEGRLRQWWEAEAVSRFEGQAVCVEELYDGYEVQPGVHLNGKLTLGENIADFGGIRQAHRAYLSWADQHGVDPRGEAVAGLTREQLLFVAFGQLWCTNSSEQVDRVQALTDPHAHPRYRVNGPLANLPGFWDAFSCEEGQPMHPKSTCEVW